MPNIFEVKTQKLFLITIILKIGSSILGWKFNDPWVLGFAVPLIIMTIYILLGFNRRGNDLTDEKFADSCYFLGFIFTITSIILSLFDLPNIGMRIQDIAIRFGAAMVTTVFGLGVRVYLIGFKKEFADAVQESEDSIIDASQKFREQLFIAFEKFRDFQADVDTAAKATIERVNMQIEELSKNHADKLTDFFAVLTTQNQEAFTQALDGVMTASRRLSGSVDLYSEGMRENMTSIESKVVAFTEAVTNRLSTTTFPDEYFAKHLKAPLAQLMSSTNVISDSIKLTAAEVSESSVVLTAALKTLRSKAKSTEGSLDKVLNLTVQQSAVLEAANGQLTTLESLTGMLSGLDTSLSSTLAGINNSNAATSDLTTRVDTMITENAYARQSLETALTEVIGKLITNASATNAVSANLAANASATNLVAGKIADAVAADAVIANTLDLLNQQASSIIGRLDQAVDQFQNLVRQMSVLDSSLIVQNTDLKQVTELIKDVKVALVPFAAVSHGNGLGKTSIEISAECQSKEHNAPAQSLPIGDPASTEDLFLSLAIDEKVNPELPTQVQARPIAFSTPAVADR